MTCITADETAQILRERLEDVAQAMEAEAALWPVGSIARERMLAKAGAFRQSGRIAAEVIEEYTP